jgi:hypothetical protein
MARASPADYISVCDEMTESPLSAATAAAKALGHPARLRLRMLPAAPLRLQMTAVLDRPSMTRAPARAEAGNFSSREERQVRSCRLAPSRDAGRLHVVRAGLPVISRAADASSSPAAADSSQEFAAGGRWQEDRPVEDRLMKPRSQWFRWLSTSF